MSFTAEQMTQLAALVAQIVKGSVGVSSETNVSDGAGVVVEEPGVAAGEGVVVGVDGALGSVSGDRSGVSEGVAVKPGAEEAGLDGAPELIGRPEKLNLAVKDLCFTSEDELSSDSYESAGSGPVFKGVPPSEPAAMRSKQADTKVADQEDELRGSFFSDFVRTPDVKRLRKVMKTNFGCKIPDHLVQVLALVTYTAGTVPSAFVDGKKRICRQAMLGDAAAALAMVECAIQRGDDVSSVQAMKSSILTNSAMCQALHDSGLYKFIRFAPGVDYRHAKSGADAFEAIIGIVYQSSGIPGVVLFLKRTGLYKGS